jgi:protein SMG6
VRPDLIFTSLSIVDADLRFSLASIHPSLSLPPLPFLDFAFSLITNNPFAASRESILPLFDTALQSKRFHPDATAAELFVLLHGMIFTKIQLDDFDDIFARFFERLEEDRLGTKSLPQVEWVMMGVINLAACLQYGVEDGLLRKASAEETSRRGGGRKEVVEPAGPQAIMMHAGGGGAKKAEGEEGDGSDEGLSASGTQPPPSAAEGEVRSLVRKIFSAEDVESLPLPFRHALRLSFSILSFCLAHPIRKDTLSNAIINPYIPIFLTFLSTVVKQPAALALVERNVPWDALVLFFNTIPRKIEVRMDVSPKLTAGGGGPLPEDWCLRGMEWVGRRVFERGFWKQSSMSSSGRKGGGGAAPPDLNGLPRSTNTIQSEMDVLAVEMETLDVEQQLREGIVDGEGDSSLEAQELTSKRWKRIAWSVGVFVRQVPGLGIEASNGRKVRIEEGGALRGKMEGWEEERRRSREADEAAEEKKRKDEDARGLASTGGSGGDEAWLEEEEEPTDEDDEQDPELRELKVHLRSFPFRLSIFQSLTLQIFFFVPLQAQRRNLQAILRASRNPKSSTQNLPPLSSFRNPRPPKPPSSNKNLPHVIPGYTVLVFDTNVLLSSLPLFTALVESARWTAMVPLPVITELDGLSNQPPPLGTEASKALSYLTDNIRSHSRTLKVQTSRGNYLSDLTIRTEDISFSGSSSSTMHGGQLGERARNMDDLILRACGFQEEHFVDRTGILGVSDGLRAEEKEKAAKVVLLTFDRNLRLRAKARGVESVDEKGMKKILAVAG